MRDTNSENPLFVKEYRTAVAVRGPLVTVERVSEAGYNELAELATAGPGSAPARQKGAAPPAFAVASPQPG